MLGMAIEPEDAARAVRHAAIPLTGAEGDYDALLELVGDARFVLLGEATHGTHEFYRARADITRRLVREKGFTAVAVEADWPDAYRVNRYVRGQGGDASADEALGGFERFPQWMWRNTEIIRLVEGLRRHNQGVDDDAAVGFYGLDLYSLYTSIAEVVRYLETVDRDAARRARERYACFEHFQQDPQAYGYMAGRRGQDCEDGAVRQLVELQQRAAALAGRDGLPADEHFVAAQNARLVKNAEEYYRQMYRGRANTWNLRDCHMADTLDALARHFADAGREPRIVVWEHNSHLGDARATEMGESGEWNVGQLVRERHGSAARLVGFTTYTGTVTAADDWDEPAQRMAVRPARPDSYEGLFHEAGVPNFLLPLRAAGGELLEALGGERLERAIGVIYRPRTERQSHYFLARLADQFDAVIHFDETTALTPLEIAPMWENFEPPETYPSGM
jgi:erythromycin esterase-like protein